VEQLDHLLGHQEGRIVLKRAQRGVTLIELMIGLAIFAVLLFIGVPAFTEFIQNTQIRNAAENTLSALNLARAEALRRNTSVRFQFVSDLTSGCTLSTSSLAWVVSLANPAGACDAAPSNTTAPQIVQKRSGTEGTRTVQVAATGGSTVVFTGLGRAQAGGITQINFSNSMGVCEHVSTSGTMRCLRILVTTGGQAKVCDPKVTDNTDPRFCA
jgi:type IV fimbrial biogenesis protein FimT